nr:MAG TPA: hypothetical protein [Caudoviricetes sp.]
MELWSNKSQIKCGSNMPRLRAEVTLFIRTNT